MKQPRFDDVKPVTPTPIQTQEVARGFAHIGELMRGGRDAEAWRAANALYAKYPKDATANFIIALILQESDQEDDALPYAEAAVKFAPDNARYLVFLGKLYVDLRMIEFAPDVLNKAFALDKTLYQAPWALAHYYLTSGQGSRALPYFDLALQSVPQEFSHLIRLNRADCLRSMGRIAEAEADYKLVMEAPKLRVQALIGSAMLQKNDQTSIYATQIRKELESPQLTKNDRSSLLLCLGILHENGRDYDSAFSNFVQSRALLESRYDADAFKVIVDDAINILTREVFEKFKSYGSESEKPIFVIGMPRSGTTLTEQIIGSHSQAEGVGELTRMAQLAVGNSGPLGMSEVLRRMVEWGPERWKDVPQKYLNLINALAPEARRTVDKMPHNFLCLGFIRLCFPNAKIIHCKRNPLDSFVSAFQNDMNDTHAYSFNQVSYAEYYINYLRLMDHWKKVLPGGIHESQYELLTANPEAEVRKMLDFLELSWEDACLKFNERESTVNTFSRLQVRKPINTGSVARWRNYEKHLGPIISVFERAGIEI